MKPELFLTALGGSLHGTLKLDEPLSRHTTWKIGGPADVLIQPADEEDIQLIISLCSRFHVPWWVMGSGSNLLILDGGIRGVVIKMAGVFTDLSILGGLVEAGSGVPLPRLARETARYGLSGLEWCAGIPASTGGATVMNAGIGTNSFGDFVQRVQLVDGAGRVRSLTREELVFAYRFSSLQKVSGIVTRVHLDLPQADPEKCLGRLQAHLDKRKASQPLEFPTAGSVFKNPPDDYAGRLLEAAGVKGMLVGNARVSEKHANFIINLGGAEAKDVLKLINQMRTRVEEVFRISLETEVRIVGEER